VIPGQTELPAMTTQSDTSFHHLPDDKQFKQLVDGIADYAIYMLTLDGHVMSWNAGAQRIKGYLPQEIIGQHFSVFYIDEDQALGLPTMALQSVLTDGKFDAEGWRVRQDGSRFWASVVIDPIRSESGELLCFAKITRDISERKAVQETLRDSEQRFRLLVQGVTDYAIYMLSPTGEITNWNAGAARIKGYTHDEVVGTNYSRFYTDADRQAGMPAQALRTAAKVGRYEQEGWRVRKDGSTFWAHVVIDAIHDEQGTLVGFAKITRDITEKMLAADALSRANAELFQSQKMEAIGQLTAGIAHDFNNLLGVLGCSVDVLAMQMTDGENAVLAQSMKRAVQRGAALTEQLLTFARQQPLKVEHHNLNTVIGGFESVLRRASTSAIHFEFKLSPRLHTVLIDAACFEATLLNLIVNARDAMPQGGSLVLATDNAEIGEREMGALTAGSYVKVTVTDTGTGMSQEVAARAFEPFFTTKEVGKGTGLGLSQAYGFIAQSGGAVSLKSKIGQGTTFTIYLPAVAISPVDSDRDAHESIDTVLIVEDEPDLLRAAAVLFRHLGFEVVTAGNGKDAIEILEREEHIDILFADVMMPNGMSGVQLACVTRERWPAIKVILASGYPSSTLHTQHGDLNDFAFIGKPYGLSEVAKKLRAIA
jgi:PAS domain S-box-containing protein